MRFSARAMAAPGKVAVRGCGSPFALSGDTSVASTASGTPWRNGNPDATISMRRSSSGPMPGTVVSLRNTFSRTRAPASRKTRAQVFSSGRPRFFTRPVLMHPFEVKACRALETSPRRTFRSAAALRRRVSSSGSVSCSAWFVVGACRSQSPASKRRKRSAKRCFPRVPLVSVGRSSSRLVSCKSFQGPARSVSCRCWRSASP